MAGSPETAIILDALNATRASARERQDELERKIRDEARKLRQGVADGKLSTPCSCIAIDFLALAPNKASRTRMRCISQISIHYGKTRHGSLILHWMSG